MRPFSNHKLQPYLSEYGPVLFTFIWCFGLSCGFWLVSPAEPFLFNRMNALRVQRGSIPGLLAIRLCPFIISALGIYFHHNWLLYLFCFLFSFLIGATNSWLLHLYGSAAWLISFLLLFSHFGSIVILLWFWFRNINRTDTLCIHELLFFITMVFVLCMIDYLIVRPFGLRFVVQ